MPQPPQPAVGLAEEFDRGAAVQATPSARSWLLTILGTFVLPAGGSAWTTSLVDALGLVGVETGTARQALTRAARAGWITRSKHGRRVRWSLTERAQLLLSSGAQRIYSFGQEPVSWDGRWLLLFASVPESRRDARYKLRTSLNWAGFGSLGPGVWLSPSVEREGEAIAALAALDEPVAARTFVARHGDIGDEVAIVGEAWDLASLDAAYRAFLADTETLLADSDEAAAHHMIVVTHRWRQFPAMDPALPSTLLPPGWPGGQAATRFASLNASLGPRAATWWAANDR